MVVVYKHLQVWMEKSSYSLLPSANKFIQEMFKGLEVL